MSQKEEAQAEAEGRLTIAAEPVAEAHLAATESTGEWIQSDQLREAALALLARDANVHLSLASVDHLDTSALQVILALSAGLKGKGHTLELADLSPALEKWFGYAGATALLDRNAGNGGPGEVAQP
jgi:ABC-type transporter Mla MlaB component